MATAVGGGSDVEVGFAKLQGEDFEYYMQSYSIILGRNSKKATVDVDLSSLGGGMNISRNHARIFYDFTRRRFSLEVLGKNGCFVEGVLHLPGNPNVKLDSQDLLQIGDKEFYFLLPVRSILDGPLGPRHHVSGQTSVVPYHNYHSGPGSGSGKKAVRSRELYEFDVEDDDVDDDEEDIRGSEKKTRRDGYEVVYASGDFEYKFYCSDCYLNLVRLGLNDSDPTTLYLLHVCREEEIKADVNITEEEAFEILRLANQSSGSSSCNGSRSLINGAKNAWDMLHEEESLPRITTSCSDLDSILGGGISCRDVSEH
ncbi:unnamed protein product [Arabidopsis halleri]